MLCEVGTLVAPNEDGSQTINLVGSWTPKVIKLFSSGPPVSNAFANSLASIYGIGVAGGGQASVSIRVLTGQSTSDAIRSFHGSRIASIAGAAAIAKTAELTGVDAGEFTLDWSSDTSAEHRIAWLALGGDDISDAALLSLASPTSTGKVSYTDPGFEPDYLEAFTVAANVGASDHVIHTFISAGWATKDLTQRSVGGVTQNGVSTSYAKQSFRTDRFLHPIWSGSEPNPFFSAELTDILANGFELDWHAVVSPARRFFVLALKGGRYKIQPYTHPTSDGPQTVNVGFDPVGAVLAGSQQTTAASYGDHHRGYWGAVGSPGQAVAWWGDRHNVGTTITKRRMQTSQCVFLAEETAADGTILANAEGSLVSGGVELDWLNTDVARDAFLVAFGSDEEPPDTFTAAASLTASSQTLEVSAEHDTPEFTASVSLVATPQQMAAGVATDDPEFTAAVSLVASSQAMQVSAGHEPPELTAAVDLVASSQQLEAAVLTGEPEFAAAVSLFATPQQMAAAASAGIPDVEAAVLLVASPQQLSADAFEAVPFRPSQVIVLPPH